MPLSASAKFRIDATPSLSIRQTYDDNINLDKNNRKSDYLTSVEPSIGIKLHSNRDSASFYYSPSFVRYNKKTHDNAIRHDAKIDYQHRFSRKISFDFNDKFMKSDDPLEDYDTGSTTGSRLLSDVREIFWRNDAGISTKYILGKDHDLITGYDHNYLKKAKPDSRKTSQHTPFLTYHHRIDEKNRVSFDYRFFDHNTDSKAAPSATDDFIGHDSTIGYSYKYGNHMEGSLSYGLNIRRFDDSSENYMVHDFGVGIQNQVNENNFFGISAGFFKKQSENSLDNESGVNFSAVSSKKIKNGNISMSVAHGWDEGFLEIDTRNFTKYWTCDFDIGVNLYKYVRTHAGVSYRSNSDKNNNESIYEGTGGISWTIHRWLTLNADYTYRKRTSDNPGDEYVDNRIVLSLTAFKDIKWINN